MSSKYSFLPAYGYLCVSTWRLNLYECICIFVFLDVLFKWLCRHRLAQIMFDGLMLIRVCVCMYKYIIQTYIHHIYAFDIIQFTTMFVVA